MILLYAAANGFGCCCFGSRELISFLVKASGASSLQNFFISYCHCVMDRLKELKKGAASPEDINVEVDSDRGDYFIYVATSV